MAGEAFSAKERAGFWKKKWRREHIALIAVCAAAAAACLCVPPLIGRGWLAGALFPVALVEYGVLHNRMMAYVEHKLYDAQ